MAKVRVLLAAGLASVAALAIQAPGLAQDKTGTRGTASGPETRSLAADQALLEALLKRRAEVAQSVGGADVKRAALAFLDREIAELRTRIAK